MQQETPYGMLKPPLGSARLTVIALLAVLLRTSSPVAEEAVISSHILKQVLHLVLQYPFNSILHHQVCPSNFCDRGKMKRAVLPAL